MTCDRIYTKTFQLSNFEWIGNAKRVVEMICNAGKSSEFVDLIEKRFDHENDTVADFEISKWVIDEVVSIMGSLGLTLDGKPVKKKFKVFYRITGVSYEEVEADNAAEARVKFLEEFDKGDPLHCIERDDIETVVPIAYEYEGDEGDTKDYGPSEESMKELQYAIGSSDVFALVRIEQKDSGNPMPPKVSLHTSFERAKSEMRTEYAAICNACGDGVWRYQDPKDGNDTCSVTFHDWTQVRWYIVKAETV